MKWFRFYDAALDDPKVQRLSGVLFKAWVNLLCLASRQDSRGQLPPISQTSFALRCSEERALFALEELAARGLLDREEGGFSIHNWGLRQFESDNTTARVQRFRERARNGERNPPRGEAEQNRTETETEADAEADGNTSPTLSALTTAFVARWPRGLNPTTLADLTEIAERLEAEPEPSVEATIRYCFEERDRAGADWRYTKRVFERLEAEGWPVD